MPSISAATVTGYNLDSNYNPVYEDTDTVNSNDQNTELVLRTSGATGDTIALQIFDPNGQAIGSYQYGAVTSDTQTADSYNPLPYLGVPSGNYTVEVSLKNGSGGTDATYDVPVAYTNLNPDQGGMVPEITAFSTDASSGTGTVGPGQTLTFTVGTSEAVSVDGAPTLQLSNGEVATYDAQASDATSLVFSYTPSYGHDTSDLQVTGDNPNGALNLNGGSITDANGNALDGEIQEDTGYAVAYGPPQVTISPASGTIPFPDPYIYVSADPSLAGDLVGIYEGDASMPLSQGTLSADGTYGTSRIYLQGYNNELHAVVTTPDGQKLYSNVVDLSLESPTIAFEPLATVGRNGDVTFTLDGTAPGGYLGEVNVELYNDGNDLGTAQNNLDGTFTLTVHAGLNPPDGTTLANITAIASDDANGTSAVATSPDALIVGTNQDIPLPDSFAGRAPKYTTVQYAADALTGGYDATFYNRAGQPILAASAYEEGDATRTQYFGGSFFDNKSYYSFSDLQDHDGNLLQETRYNNDGTTSFDIPANDQTVTAYQNDTFNNQGYNNRFVFTPGFGDDEIDGFQFYGNNRDHILLNVAQPKDFGSWVNNHVTVDGTSLTLHLGSGDTLTLDNVLDAPQHLDPKVLAKDLRFTG